MTNKLEDLRNHLFAQLERLTDNECLLEDEIERSKSIVALSNTIIDSARVENEFLEIKVKLGITETTNFIPVSAPKQID